MRVGIVCPYSFDAPGGVQFHVRDLAQSLIERGHYANVLAPSSKNFAEPWFTSAGSSVAIPYNGSVAKLSFGPIALSRTHKWLEQGEFDVVHIHEPETPSVGLLALMDADAPIVATFHAAFDRSRLRAFSASFLAPQLEKIAARIAVSEEARRTLIEHNAGDSVVIPNGVYTQVFRDAPIDSRFQGTPTAPVIAFLGRLDEPRKGLEVYAQAVSPVVAKYPQARFVVAGRGQANALQDSLAKYPKNVVILGEITDAQKAALLKSASIYVAPHLGGESFGIVLVEAMAAGTPVAASDLAAFSAVLNQGQAGCLFETGSAGALAQTLLELLADQNLLEEVGKAGQMRSRIYDWSVVTDQILAVYQAVIPGSDPLATGTALERFKERWNKGKL